LTARRSRQLLETFSGRIFDPLEKHGINMHLKYILLAIDDPVKDNGFKQ
jgi:hypothetical protein